MLYEAKQMPKKIKKSNDLIFTQQDLTAREANLFAVMIAHMKPEDWDEKTSPQYVFTRDYLVEWLNLNSRAVSSELKKISTRLVNRKIASYFDLPSGEQDFTLIPLLKGIEYKNGLMTLTPNDLLKKEYIEYRKGFALIETTTYLALKREYTKKLYEMLSRFKSPQYRLSKQSVGDLKAYMGLMTDVKPIKLKQNKQSFADTYLFIKRCIKDSIKELHEHPIVKKELLFKESADGLGFKLHKRGREIAEIEFLYHWISKNQTVENLLSSDALSNIRELEYKHSVKKQQLSIEELELLSHSYKSIEEYESADKVDDAILKRYKQKIKEDVTEKDDNKAFLDRIKEMKKVNGNEEY